MDDKPLFDTLASKRLPMCVCVCECAFQRDNKQDGGGTVSFYLSSPLLSRACHSFLILIGQWRWRTSKACPTFFSATPRSHRMEMSSPTYFAANVCLILINAADKTVLCVYILQPRPPSVCECVRLWQSAEIHNLNESPEQLTATLISTRTSPQQAALSQR